MSNIRSNLGQRDGNRMAELESRIRGMENLLRQVPSRINIGASPTDLYIIEGGNSLAGFTGVTGIKCINAAPADIAEYLDLESLPTCIDGVGYARSIDTGRFALVLNCLPYSDGYMLPKGWRIWAYQTLAIPITGESPVRNQTFLLPAGVM